MEEAYIGTICVGPHCKINSSKLIKIISGELKLVLSRDTEAHLSKCRAFIDHLMDQDTPIYGITTGVGDLRKVNVSPQMAEELSKSLIRSHDAGIGDAIPYDVTLGAMIITCNSLAKGYSGFSPQSLQTLIDMINHRIVPIIPESGSLGASGDLAYLARLGRAMMGDPVKVWYNDKVYDAGHALKLAEINAFNPKSKEGLALINGTSFMASNMALAYKKQIRLVEAMLSLMGVFLNSVNALDSAFSSEIQDARTQHGQKYIASILREFLADDYCGVDEVQNDYCIRCIPQIFGPRIEIILEQKRKMERELDAITDNPLIFHNTDLDSPTQKYPFEFEGKYWGIFSGGNFHGENLTTVADAIALSNAKMAITIERQIAYLLNPQRNGKKFPTHLIPKSEQMGIRSGFMIPHYTSNALVHKICLLGQPSSLMNITSSNESEDVVSYGATACQKLSRQQILFEDLLAIYALAVCQSYSMATDSSAKINQRAKEVFDAFSTEINFPVTCKHGFEDLYNLAKSVLTSTQLGRAIGNPLMNHAEAHEAQEEVYANS